MAWQEMWKDWTVDFLFLLLTPCVNFCHIYCCVNREGKIERSIFVVVFFFSFSASDMFSLRESSPLAFSHPRQDMEFRINLFFFFFSRRG